MIGPLAVFREDRRPVGVQLELLFVGDLLAGRVEAGDGGAAVVAVQPWRGAGICRAPGPAGLPAPCPAGSLLRGASLPVSHRVGHDRSPASVG